MLPVQYPNPNKENTMPAYFDTGFSVRQPMWHGEGLVLADYPTDYADARAKAGLLWEPEVTQPYYPIPRAAWEAMDQKPAEYLESGGSFFVPSNDTRIVIRPDTGAELAPVSDEFQLVYHGGKDRASMENIVDAFSGVAKTVRFETMGSARGGRDVWVLLYLDEPYTVPGDDTEHLPFLALLNSHGGGACKLTFTQVRVVCWNTFQMASAEGDNHGKQIVFRHVGNVAERIEQAKGAIGELRSETTAYTELAADLMQLKADDRAVTRFLQEFLPDPAENGEVTSDRVRANVDRAREVFRTIYLDSVTTESVRGTAWGLVQSATEYLDHSRAYRSTDTYLGRSILRGEPAKAKAVQIARLVCA